MLDDHSTEESEGEDWCPEGDCSDEYHDGFADELEGMDQCLTHTNTDNEIHYRAVGPCMKQFNSLLDGTIAPELCKNDSRCASDPFDWALNFGTTYADKSLTDIGLARDGHVIKGPYNEDGELWSCDQIDICNGTFLSDGSYAYVAT